MPRLRLSQSLLTVLCGLYWLLTPTTVAQAEAPPNIVFIMADDLGWADVAFHGGNTPTPHLDRLAQQGVELTQHYVAPVCSPTRTGLLTGRCWSRFGVVNPQNERALPKGTTTMASALRSVGYATCLAGKWHLGSLPEWGPNHFGFDHAYGSLAGGVSPWNHRYKQGPYTHTWHRNERLLEESGHVTDLITQEAVTWLEQNHSSPFLLYVPYTAVHLPVKEPPQWLEKVPANIEGEVPRHYAASIAHLDDSVGRILAALEHNQLREHTLVVFTSDNGGSTAENNDLKYPDDNCPNGKLPGDNRPWRGQKGDLYEGGTRVPTLIHWPGHLDAQHRPAPQLDTAIQITDWLPTFCELASVEPPADGKWDGTSLAGLLLRGEPLGDRPLYAVGPNWKARSLRWQNWKLIAFENTTPPRFELYDLQSDPQESHNLADTQPDRLRDMQSRLRAAATGDARPVTGGRD